jgi:hypothetical protein
LNSVRYAEGFHLVQNMTYFIMLHTILINKSYNSVEAAAYMRHNLVEK